MIKKILQQEVIVTEQVNIEPLLINSVIVIIDS